MSPTTTTITTSDKKPPTSPKFKSPSSISATSLPTDIDIDVDIAAAYASDITTYIPQEAKRLRWKLDLRLVPLLWFNVTLGAMDKVTTATAAL
ncbi:MAG: hypothetical protein M1834_006904 [Cirrosporium novae-zelandiae]|nr:MAG: hypothetical protein M1834_006904 [Cirrosporium novae-zelandiae]